MLKCTVAQNVLVKLQHKYHFQHFNFVGHSMGNMTLSQYMLTYGNDKSLPKLDKQVNIAVHLMVS